MSTKRNYVVLAEKAVGHPLPMGAIVHHIDRDRTNNNQNNLVVLQSQAEHLELHRKLRVLIRGGDPWKQASCATCKQLKDFSMFGRRKSKRTTECKRCIADRRHKSWCKENNRENRFLTPEERSSLNSSLAIRRWSQIRG